MSKDDVDRPERSLSLRAVDVGFDLRLHPDKITHIPSGARTVHYDGPGGQSASVSGTPAAICRVLQAAGYHVKVACLAERSA